MIELTALQLAVAAVGAVVVGVGLVIVVARTLLRNRPAARSSARDRLLATNPWLADKDKLRWTVRARRVRVDRLTTTVVGVALTLMTLRPSTVTTSDVDR